MAEMEQLDPTEVRTRLLAEAGEAIGRVQRALDYLAWIVERLDLDGEMRWPDTVYAIRRRVDSLAERIRTGVPSGTVRLATERDERRGP